MLWSLFLCERRDLRYEEICGLFVQSVPMMNASAKHRLSYLSVALMIAATLSLPGCGSTDSPTSPSETVLLNTTVNVVAGVTCATGGVSTDFTGTAGKSTTITASGAANLTPRFTLYAPDFTTQLAGSTSTGAGAASLTFTLVQNGTHHVSVCDLAGVAGSLTVRVVQR